MRTSHAPPPWAAPVALLALLALPPTSEAQETDATDAPRRLRQDALEAALEEVDLEVDDLRGLRFEATLLFVPADGDATFAGDAAYALKLRQMTAPAEPRLALDDDFSSFVIVRDTKPRPSGSTWGGVDPKVGWVTPEGNYLPKWVTEGGEYVSPVGSTDLTISTKPTKPTLLSGCESEGGGLRLDEWKEIFELGSARSAALATVAAATGCITDPDESATAFYGTAWVLDAEKGEIVTAAHVLTHIQGAPALLHRGDDLVDLDLVLELPCATERNGVHSRVRQYPLRSVAAAWDNHDVVVLQVDTTEAPLPDAPGLASPDAIPQGMLGKRDPWVQVVGYPSLQQTLQEAQRLGLSLSEVRCATSGEYDVLRRSVGKIFLSYVQMQAGGIDVLLHSADTLPGTSGAPLIDMQTGSVIGVHACSVGKSGASCGAPALASMLARDGSAINNNLAWTTRHLCEHAPTRCK